MRKTIFYLLIFSLICCNNRQNFNDKNDNEENKELLTLISKYEPLQNPLNKSICNYNLIRKVKNGKFNFEISLYSQPDSIEDPQKILVFKNPKGKYSSIPFFSNTYRDYWEFPNEDINPKVQRIQTTFDKEIDKIVRNLEISDEHIKYFLVIEIFESILWSKLLKESDSSEYLSTLRIYENKNAPEDLDSIRRKEMRLNFIRMQKDWHPKEYIFNYNSYLDIENHRTYHIENNLISDWDNPKYKIKSYRFGCNEYIRKM